MARAPSWGSLLGQAAYSGIVKDCPASVSELTYGDSRRPARVNSKTNDGCAVMCHREEGTTWITMPTGPAAPISRVSQRLAATSGAARTTLSRPRRARLSPLRLALPGRPLRPPGMTPRGHARRSVRRSRAAGSRPTPSSRLAGSKAPISSRAKPGSRPTRSRRLPPRLLLPRRPSTAASMARGGMATVSARARACCSGFSAASSAPRFSRAASTPRASSVLRRPPAPPRAAARAARSR